MCYCVAECCWRATCAAHLHPVPTGLYFGAYELTKRWFMEYQQVSAAELGTGALPLLLCALWCRRLSLTLRGWMSRPDSRGRSSCWLRHVVPDVYVRIAVVQTCGVVLTCLCAVLPQPDPVDAIKSKMQGDSLEKPRFPTMRAAARYILKHEGPMGFFKGLGPCMLRAAPVNGATFLMFELTMRALDLVM